MAALDKLPKAGKVCRYKKLLFWPQGGLICIEDTSDEGDFRVVSRAEFFARVLTVRNLLARDGHKYADERNEDYNFVVNGCAAVKQAKAQGDPFDPVVIEQLLAQTKRSYVYTGLSHAEVVFDPIASQDGGVTQRYSPDPAAPGRTVTLHTVSQDQSPSQAAVLPPMPQKGVKPSAAN